MSADDPKRTSPLPETVVHTDKLDRWLTLGANIGVLAGIVFLGLEIRQSTLVAEIESSNRLEENFRGMTMSIWSDPDFARILKIGIEGNFTDLTDVEALRLRVFYEQVLRGWQNSYFQYLSGTSSEEIWHAQELGLANTFIQDRGLNQHWQSIKFQYSETFNALVDSWLENGELGKNGLLQIGDE